MTPPILPNHVASSAASANSSVSSSLFSSSKSKLTAPSSLSIGSISSKPHQLTVEPPSHDGNLMRITEENLYDAAPASSHRHHSLSSAAAARPAIPSAAHATSSPASSNALSPQQPQQHPPLHPSNPQSTSSTSSSSEPDLFPDSRVSSFFPSLSDSARPSLLRQPPQPQQQPPQPPQQPPQPPQPPNHQVPLHLVNLLERLAEYLTRLKYDLFNSNGANVLSCVQNIHNYMAAQLTSLAAQPVLKGSVSMFDPPAVSVIVSAILHFVDFYLDSPVFQVRRVELLAQLYSLGVLLHLVDPADSSPAFSQPSSPQQNQKFKLYGSLGPSPQLRIFSIGTTLEDPHAKKYVAPMTSKMDLLASYSATAMLDQEGAFIAPVLRGFSPTFASPVFYFGFPNFSPPLLAQLLEMSLACREVGLFYKKNRICPAGSTAEPGAPPTSNNINLDSNHQHHQTNDFNGFIAPFRVPRDPKAPPISLSLSNISQSNVSGTLGGYIFPIVDASTDKRLASYAKSTYAMTCGHVCLKKSADSQGASNPKVAVPSVFMVNYFLARLLDERKTHAPGSMEWNAYSTAINDLRDKYTHSSGDQSFGQVAWGERIVDHGMLSDIAIIRCNDNLKCRNYLGDDVSFTQYDPALRFGNLYIKSVLQEPFPAGLNVFKYGSTTKYTTGTLNGQRMVYWSEGKLKTDEFVVHSQGPFACGGDSGAWILTKTSGPASGATTLPGAGAAPSLAVVGMLHSFDGERQELGLYTPMTRILDRLYAVTKVKWGVVGIPTKDGADLAYSDNSDDDSFSNNRARM